MKSTFWKLNNSQSTFQSKSPKPTVSPARRRPIEVTPKRNFLIISRSPSFRDVNRTFQTAISPSASTPSQSKSYNYFRPHIKLFVELCPSPVIYDLKSKNLQKDLDSFHRLINYEKHQESTISMKKKFKVQLKHDLKRVTNDREELQDVNFKEIKPHNHAPDFFRAVKDGDLESVISLLVTHPELVKEIDSTQQTALHWACRRRNLDIIKYLISCNASCNAKDIVGRRPEDIARVKKFHEIYSLLHALRRRSGQTIKRNDFKEDNVQTYPLHNLMRMHTRYSKYLDGNRIT